jgi:hypothetical protein
LLLELPAPAEPDEPDEPVAPLELGDVLLPEELEPDLKCASHSEREMEPSLFLSTDENVGAEVLELEPLEPDADGVLLPLDDGELCAIATPDRARSAAAVALVTSFNINKPPWGYAGDAAQATQAPCRPCQAMSCPMPWIPA